MKLFIFGFVAHFTGRKPQVFPKYSDLWAMWLVVCGQLKVAEFTGQLGAKATKFCVIVIAVIASFKAKEIYLILTP